MRQTKLQKGKQAVIRVIDCGVALLPTALSLGSPEWQLFSALECLARESDLTSEFEVAVARKCQDQADAGIVDGKKP